MRVTSFVIAVLVASCSVAFAQTPGHRPAASKFEVFGGLSVASSDILEVDVVPGSRASFVGWNGEFTWFLQHDIGITADVSGQYGSQSLGASGNAKPATHTFLFGPKMVHRTGMFDMYAHTMVGIVHVALTAPAGFLPSGTKVSDTSMGLAIGGGLEYFGDRRVGYRIMQVDYMLSQVFGSLENNVRVATGVICRW